MVNTSCDEYLMRALNVNSIQLFMKMFSCVSQSEVWHCLASMVSIRQSEAGIITI